MLYIGRTEEKNSMDYDDWEELKEERDDLIEEIDDLIEDYNDYEIKNQSIISSLYGLRKRLKRNNCLSSDYIDDIRDKIDDLADKLDDLIDDWDETWENDWDSFDSLIWDDDFWNNKGAHFPISISKKISNVEKGIIGERRIASILESLPNEYHIVNDILIEYGKKSSQIDHVIVSPYGIFVIETKNFVGVIYGNDIDREWTQRIGNHETSFYNPFMQNKNHCYAILQCISNYYMNKLLPIVVFTSKSELNISTKQRIVHEDNLIELIRVFKEKKLTDNEIHDVLFKLENSNNTSYDAWIRHINRINNRKKRKSSGNDIIEMYEFY